VTYLCTFNKILGYRLAYVPNKYTISMFMVNRWHFSTLHMKNGNPSCQATYHHHWWKESSLTTLIFINHVEVTFNFLFSVFNIKCYQNTITLCHSQQMEWIIPQGYIFTDKYGTKQNPQNPICHLYLKLSEMWYLILEWVKKLQFPKAEYRCWFDIHTKILCFTVIWIFIQT
jgi:hypothetical protein